MIAGMILAGLAVVAAVGALVLVVLLHREVAGQTSASIPLAPRTREEADLARSW